MNELFTTEELELSETLARLDANDYSLPDENDFNVLEELEGNRRFW